MVVGVRGQAAVLSVHAFTGVHAGGGGRVAAAAGTASLERSHLVAYDRLTCCAAVAAGWKTLGCCKIAGTGSVCSDCWTYSAKLTECTVLAAVISAGWKMLGCCSC
jgi:hypothetical protein